jgi:hypothetical protein
VYCNFDVSLQFKKEKNMYLVNFRHEILLVASHGKSYIFHYMAYFKLGCYNVNLHSGANRCMNYRQVC